MANINISTILLKRGNTAAASTYVGPLGELLVDTGLKTIRVQDGVTAGGMAVLATLTGFNQLSGNIANLQTTTANISANLSAFQTYANTTTANLSANLSAFQTYANATFGTSNFGNANVAAYLTTNPQGGQYSNANVASYLTTSNIITGIDANVTAANIQIANLWSNAGVQADAITSLTANAGVQSANIATLFSNAGVQADAITSLQANMTAANLAIAAASGTYSNTNVAAYLSASTTGNVGAGNLTVVNNFNSNIISANSFTYANGASILAGIGGTYSNANVSSYLSTQTFYSNTNAEAYFGANIGSLWANAGAQSDSIAGANAAIVTANTAMKSYVDNNTSTVTESNTAPTSPSAGALWWDTVSGATFIYYNNAWVDTTVNFTPPSIKPTYTVQYLAVGGGGGGGSNEGTGIGSGGGGGGGVLFNTLTITSGLSYTITVGNGGIGGNNTSGLSGGNGQISSIFEPTTMANIVALGGGGGGGGVNTPSLNGATGASGGGGGYQATGGTALGPYYSPYGTYYQGHNGGNGGGYYAGGGGGGFVSTGDTDGGNGIIISIGNVTSYYGAGGASTGFTTRSSGGDNVGGTPNINSGNAVVHTGSGGSAGGIGMNYATNRDGGYGANGVVYITYCSPTQLGTGGTVWSYTQNGYTYWMHQFTSSGTYIA